MKMSLLDVVAKGPLPYQHIYMQTSTGDESANHILNVPQTLTSLVNRNADADADAYAETEYVGAGTELLFIVINGSVWAAETPMMYPGNTSVRTLPAWIWQYIRLAMGLNGNTYATIN